MNWSFYVTRRKIDVRSWLLARGIENREQFVNHLQSISVTPPDDADLDKMFPTRVEAPKEFDEQQHAAPEGISQAPSRSVVGEGDFPSIRSSRKQNSKFRSGRN